MTKFDPAKMTVKHFYSSNKDNEKSIVAKHAIHSKPFPDISEKKGIKHTILNHEIPIFPEMPSEMTPEDELTALRQKVNFLADALHSVEKLADEQIKRNYELVWFARNYAPFSNDENVLRLLSSPEHREAIGKLLGPEREYFHGFNSGLLAAARMYKEHARMPTQDKMEVSNLWEEIMLGLSLKHSDQAEASRKDFPNTETSGWPMS